MNSGQLYVHFVSKIATSVMKYEPDSIYCLRKIKESRAWLQGDLYWQGPRF
jgi:hypothetical protein